MCYRIEHGIEIFDQFVVSEPLYAETLAPKKKGAPFVSGHLFRDSVLASIQFDDELHLKANEVYDVWTDRLLPSKFRSREPAVAKRLPEFALDAGLVAPQLAGKIALHQFPLTSKI